MHVSLDPFFKKLYGDVQLYWESKRPFLPSTAHLKFGIFYSPIHYQPDLMIIGANPGFDSDDDTKAPPDKNLFYDFGERDGKEYRITPTLRRLFRLAGHEETLRDSVVTNLLFFKSRCLGNHTTTAQGWCDNGNASIRREIEDYCRNRVEAIVCQLDPKRILVLGLATWDKVAASQVTLLAHRTRGRGRLALTGTVFNRRAFGTIHPTGARMSNTDFSGLAALLNQFLG
jgi:hypothetical protein